MGEFGREEFHCHDLAHDERWQLVERIASSPAFQRSHRLRTLLFHLSERTLHGCSDQLTEQKIGQAAFGKPADYSPLEDSSVRVHVRLLRLRLHEYFDEHGHAEHLALEIPKGNYVPVFREKVEFKEYVQSTTTAGAHRHPYLRWTMLPWVLSAVLGLACVVIWRSHRKPIGVQTSSLPNPVPWPLSQIFNGKHLVRIVVSDANYGMLRIIARKPGSLEAYLQPDYPNSFLRSPLTRAVTPIYAYISDSHLTSLADVSVVSMLFKLAGQTSGRLVVRSAREVQLGDFNQGYYVLIGSPSSNPWVSLFEGRLNFVEREGVVGKSRKWFLNRKPRLGEQATYKGLPWTGDSGEAYASIAILPNEDDNGRVLILQGLQQEGTEAAGLFLTDPHDRAKLQDALRVHPRSAEPVSFEALIRTKAVAGAPESVSLVATRLIH